MVVKKIVLDCLICDLYVYEMLSMFRGVATGGCVGCRTPLASEAVGNFLNFVLLSANLETFCFRKRFVGNISRPIRKSTPLPQQRDIEHPLDTNKDGRV